MPPLAPACHEDDSELSVESGLGGLIGDLQPGRLAQAVIPEIIGEIDALSSELETAFGGALDVADQLLESGAVLGAGPAAVLLACAQTNDIAGQRLQKIRRALHDIAARLSRLQTASAIADAHVSPTLDERRRTTWLLNGPAAPEAGVSQGFIDSVFD